MILVIAAQDDAVAHWLTHSWSGDDAVLITPSSLSARGWQFRISTAGEQTLAIDEQRVVQKSVVRGVYTRLTHVRETDLAQIEAADRTYVASEMTAFLRGWLSSLTCNVVNPATSGCLAGPYWRPERWIRSAAELGMRVRPVSRSVPSPTVGEANRTYVAVTVIGQQWFGDVEQSVGAMALSLARQSQAEILQTFFVRDESDSLTFVGADLFPEFTNPALRDALRERLLAA